MSSTNKTTYYELSQYIGTDKPTYLGDYNSDMLAIDTAIHEAAQDASTAVSTANTANATATTASSNATSALSTANNALNTANSASETAGTASTNASAALAAASAAETAAAANTITNLAPAYDPSLTYAVDDLATNIDEQGSGKLYMCIVPITTPEAFNINKWDDVTASEVFSRKRSIISSIDFTATTTWEEALNALTTGITTVNGKEYILLIETPTYTSIARMRARFNSGSVVFIDSVTSNSAIILRYINIGYNGSGVFVYENTIDNNGFTHTNKNDSAIAGENGVLKLIAFND